MSEQNEMNLTTEQLPETETPTVEEVVDESAETVVAAPVSHEEEEEVPVYVEPVFAEGFWGNCHRVLHKGWRWVKKKLHIPDLTKKQKAMVWDMLAVLTVCAIHFGR